MKRACCLLKVKKDRVEDYLKAHDVWPEELDAERKAGLRNSSLFIRKEDGFVVWYFEAEDPAASLRKLSQTKVSKRWEAKMDEFFEKTGEDSEIPDMEWLAEYFYMP